MRRELLDVEDTQAASSEDVADGHERQVGEVFVVDGVELVSLDEPQQMGKFHRDDAAIAQEDLHPTHEIIDVRNMGEDVVSDEQVRPASLPDQMRGGFTPKKSHVCGDSFA